MTFSDFKDSLTKDKSPDGSHPLLDSLWYDGKGDWNKAHELAQDVNTKEGAWVHAYLHRKEGDESNALYWYSLAGKRLPNQSLNEEWETIVTSLLTRL